jgi:hypothetical protein
MQLQLQLAAVGLSRFVGMLYMCGPCTWLAAFQCCLRDPEFCAGQIFRRHVAALAGDMLEPGLFARHESGPHETESCMPSFTGLGLGMRAHKRTLSELGVSRLPAGLPLQVPCPQCPVQALQTGWAWQQVPSQHGGCGGMSISPGPSACIPGIIAQLSTSVGQEVVM